MRLRGVLAGLVLCLFGASECRADSVALPLTVIDARGTLGLLTVETDDWAIVFSKRYNWGIQQWYDLAQDPGRTDNLASGGADTGYSQGAIFDYDVYLGSPQGPTSQAQANEFMTTMGPSATPGAATLEVLESSDARVRLRQSGHPRLNNGRGPAGNPWLELELISFTIDYTIYPTGAIYVDLKTSINPAEAVVSTGIGGVGRGISVSGDIVTAVGGVDFVAEGIFEGDFIESAGGGFGPVQIIHRINATQLRLQTAAPTGSALDYVVRRPNISNETISVHADGDPTSRVQCVDPAVARWKGGSDTNAEWNLASGCGSLLSFTAGDRVLAHWAIDRPAAALLARFQPWIGSNFGAFNSTGFIDLSYTQWGRGGVRPPETHDRQFLVRLGSSAPSGLPSIASAAAALPFAEDYLAPYVEAIVGQLAMGPEVAGAGFVPSAGHYAIAATGGVASIRFDADARSGGPAIGYFEPSVLVSGMPYTPALDLALSTNNGVSFAPLDSGDYNAAALGPGLWLVQYLGQIPPTATGANAIALRVSVAADSDGDGLPDVYEDDTGTFVDPAHTGSDPNNEDSDGDGVMDGIEVSLGTDPNNPLDFPNVPVLRMIALGLSVGGILLAFGLVRKSRPRSENAIWK